MYQASVEHALTLIAALVRRVQTKDAVAWLSEMLDYNVPLGKLNRGLAVLDGTLHRALHAVCFTLVLPLLEVQHALTPPTPLGVRALRNGTVSQQEAFLAMAVGWCIEWLQAFFLVADDMMDHSITRRGQPCWYKLPHVGLNACNDCIVLEACIYKILKKHARQLPCYTEVRAVCYQSPDCLPVFADRYLHTRSCWSCSTM
jgi:farnesyl diphosphate synthase